MRVDRCFRHGVVVGHGEIDGFDTKGECWIGSAEAVAGETLKLGDRIRLSR